jgi:putative membrane protein
MRKVGLGITACLLLLAAPATGQSLGEKTGVNSALGITSKTADFVKELASSDMFAIQSSQLPAFKTGGNIQAFANQMQTAHAKILSDRSAGNVQFAAKYVR